MGFGCIREEDEEEDEEGGGDADGDKEEDEEEEDIDAAVDTRGGFGWLEFGGLFVGLGDEEESDDFVVRTLTTIETQKKMPHHCYII